MYIHAFLFPPFPTNAVQESQKRWSVINISKRKLFILFGLDLFE